MVTTTQKLKPSGRVFKRENANPVLRKCFKSQLGYKIALFGRHGFDYIVTIQNNQNQGRSMIFDQRQQAENHYYQLTKMFVR